MRLVLATREGTMPERKLRTPRYESEEFARRAKQIYDRDVLPNLTPADDYKLVAIDVDSGGYEIDADDLAACNRLLDRYPDAQIFVLRVGQPAAYRLGSSSIGEFS